MWVSTATVDAAVIDGEALLIILIVMRNGVPI